MRERDAGGEIVATKGQTSPRTVTRGLREQAWWVLRNKKEATLDGLLTTIANGHEKDARSNIGKYLRALERAGILRRAKRRVPGDALTSNGHIRYLLEIDCGRDAPVWRAKTQTVYAPSTGESYMCREVQP